MQCVDCGVTYRRSRWNGPRHCRPCYLKFLEKQRDTYYLTTYGIDLEDYNRMWASQEGLCAACGCPESRIDPKTRKPKQLYVDHCHVTGRVRGLLCSNCNSALGLLKDDPKRVAGLLAYVERQQQEAEKAPEVIRKQKPVSVFDSSAQRARNREWEKNWRAEVKRAMHVQDAS